MRVIEEENNKITYRYDNANERNMHCNEMLYSNYTITYLGGKGTSDDPLIVTYISTN